MTSITAPRRVMNLVAAFLLMVGVVAAGLVGVPAARAVTGDLIITGAIDGPLAGGTPKAMELYVVNNIADLSIYGVGSANNGGGTDGEEFTFPAVAATAGDFIYIASEATEFNNWFGFAPDYTSAAMFINGDDAIELFMNASVVDVFGDINVDGSGQPWEYADGWAYRNDGTGADGTTFTLANWSFSGPDALDAETTNAGAGTPFPTGSYSPVLPEVTPPLINEFVVSHGGSDTSEFVEIFGDPSTDYSAYTIVEIEGDSGSSLGEIDDGTAAVGSTDGSGYWTTGFQDNLYENGSVTLLLVEDYSGALEQDLDTNDDGVLDVTPWTSIIDAVAVNDGDGGDFTYGTPELTDAMDSGSFPPGGASRIPNGTDTDAVGDWVRNNFDGAGLPCCGGALADPGEAINTPGAVNSVQPALPIINEVDADQSGGDDAEFVELYDGGAGNTPLDGLVVVFFNGSDDQSYGSAFDLDGESTDGDGYFVLGNAGVSGVDLVFTNNSLQNGPDAVALFRADGADFPNDTAVTTDNLVDAIVYDTNDSDDAGLLPLLNASQPQVNEDGGVDSTTDSNQRCPNGSGGERNTDTYEQHAPTPDALNTCPVELFIHEVQGAGDATPFAGSFVIVEGVVVGDFQDTGLAGFYLQEEDDDADGSEDTSEGILVFDDGFGVDVAMGDTVRVLGKATEFFDLTEINNVLSVEIIDEDPQVATPATLVFPLDAVSDLEKVEGMGVIIPQAMTIVEYFNFDRFGEIAIATERLQQPTAVHEPGSTAAADLADLNARSRIGLDDGDTTQNPEVTRHPNGAPFTLGNRFRGGDLLTDVVGVMHYSFGNYIIEPTGPAEYTAVNPRPASPASVGGDVTVAAFNVLNYFSTLDTGPDICGPNADQGCRGADNAGEFTRQRDKIIAAIAEMDADVVGLIEIENHATDAALIDLVAGLNAEMGAGTYDYVAAGPTGPDVIKVAFIYKPGTMELKGGHAILDTAGFLDPNNTGDDRNRAALAQTFKEKASGESFTVAVNHFKSKGSACGAGDDDPEAASCNLTRTLAAQVLADWLATDPTGGGSAGILVIGDLNAYDKEDPIDAMKAGADDTASTDDDYRELNREFIGENAYSYVFSGQWGYLDYALANEALRPSVTGATVWHINSDEPDLIDYDTSFKSDGQDAIYADDLFRSSDHDPVIVGLNLADFPVPTLPETGVGEALRIAAPAGIGLLLAGLLALAGAAVIGRLRREH